MCEFNTGCPGHEVDDGFVPCTPETVCASGVVDDAENEVLCAYCGLWHDEPACPSCGQPI